MAMADQAMSYDPRRLAADTTRAALFQDVVRATSRGIHGARLDADDRKALQSCRDLLRRVASNEIALPTGGLQQLDSTSKTLAFLRAARPPTSDDVPTDYFRQLADSVRRALGGDQSDATVLALRELRDIFLMVGELALDRSVRLAENEEAGGQSTLTTASSSL